MPESLRAEHVSLHHELTRMMRDSGPTGAAAREVSLILHRHFLSEEQWALPLLALLPLLAQDRVPMEIEEAIAAADRLRNELPQMLEDHRQLVVELDRLIVAAHREGKTADVEFARRMKEHARLEEEVLYPAALVVGAMLQTKRLPRWGS